MKALFKKKIVLQISGFGVLMQKEAGRIMVKHYRELAFMGFVEVLFNLKTILSNIKVCKRHFKFKRINYIY
jgi:lipid-A-disaccharide synthase